MSVQSDHRVYCTLTGLFKHHHTLKGVSEPAAAWKAGVALG